MRGMRAVGLRWGFVMGLLAATLGVGALALGAIIEPLKGYTSANAAVVALFIRGLLALFALGLMFCLAYFTGIRIERIRLGMQAHAPDEATRASAQDTSGAALAGGLIALCYSLVTTLYDALVSTTPATLNAPQSGLSTFLGHLFLLVIFVLIGAGLGGLGRRAPAARSLLDRITAPTSTASEVQAPVTLENIDSVVNKEAATEKTDA